MISIPTILIFLLVLSILSLFIAKARTLRNWLYTYSKETIMNLYKKIKEKIKL